MAGFQDVQQDPETGELWVQERGRKEYRRASQAEVDASFESGGEGLVNAAGRGFEQVGRGAAQVISSIARPLNELIPGWEFDEGADAANRARLDQLAAAQSAAGRTNPIASTIGSLAPDVALGAATLGAGLPATLGGRAGLFALEGAGMGAAYSPDAPLQGAALGGVLGLGGELVPEAFVLGSRQTRGFGRGAVAGQRVADGVPVLDEAAGLGGAVDAMRQSTRPGGLEGWRTGGRSVPADAAAAAERRSLGAAGNPAPDVHQGGARQLEGIADSADMIESGFRMTDTQARMLDSTNGMELQALRRMDSEEEVAARTRPVSVMLSDSAPGAPKTIDRSLLAQEQQAWVNKTIAEEMGISGKSALDSKVIERRVGEIRAEFERITAETPGPIDMRGVQGEWERILDRNLIHQGNPAYNTAERIFAELASYVKKDATGEFRTGPVKQMAAMRTKLSERIEAAAKTPKNQEVANVLKELREELDERIQKNWTPEMKEDFTTAQKQWFVAKAARDTRAAVGARGDMNLATFMGNYEGAGSSRKTALLTAVNRPFFERMKAAQAVMAKEVGDSGTGTTMGSFLSKVADTALSQIPGVNLLR